MAVLSFAMLVGYDFPAPGGIRTFFLKLESSVGENTRLFLNEAGAMAAKLLSTLKLQSQGCIDGLYFFWENVMEAEKIRVHRNRYLMVGLLARQSTKDFVILL